jgi:hypothetical protein
MGYNLYKVGGFCMVVGVKPIQCYSSLYTEKLLEWRNPHRETEALSADAKIDNYFIHVGKVLITEVGSIGLVVTSAVELVGYEIAYFASLPFVKSQKREYYNDLCDSSRFTTLWNFSNLVFFNWYCSNLVADEPVARYVIDYVYGSAIAEMTLAVMAFVVGAPKNYPLFGRVQLRDKDALYLLNTYKLEEYSRPNFLGRIINKAVKEASELLAWKQPVEHFFAQCNIDDGFSKWVEDRGNQASFKKLVIMRHLYQLVTSKMKIPAFYEQRTQEMVQGLRTDLDQTSLSPGHTAFMERYFLSYQPQEAASHVLCNLILSKLKSESEKYIDKPLFQRAWNWVCKERGYL